MSNKNLRLLVLLIFFFALRSYTTQARNHTTTSQTYEVTGKSNKTEWFTFPYTIQISPYMGLTKHIPQLLKRTDGWKHWQQLCIVGASVDVGVFQIRKFIWKHFQCYPKLGLAINYGRLENKGDLIGGLLYLEPRHNYLARCEVCPRLSIGIVYANIPGTNFKKRDSEDEAKTLSDDAFANDWYRQGLHLDLSLSLAMHIKLTPHWQLSSCVGFSYMPLAVNNSTSKGAKHSPKDTDLKIITGNIGLCYTPNPSLVHYPSVGNNEKSSVHIGLLATVKKQQIKHATLPDQPDSTNSGSKYCHVSGVYGQWSLQLYKRHAITLTTEWFYDQAIKQKLQDTVKPSPVKMGILVGHEFRWGRIRFGQQLGCYLKTNELYELQQKLPTYARLGLNYQLTEYFFVGTSLKTTMLFQDTEPLAKTDFIDFRIGYSF